VAPADVQPLARTRPPEDGDERVTLCGLLDFLRATVVNKVAGLTDEQARRQPLDSSALTPAGLVKHLTGVERFWFSIDFAGADIPLPWSDDDPHGGFVLAADDTLASVVRSYVDECERSRVVVARSDLDDVAAGVGMSFRLRYAVAHMVEETARHCGHLDLMRERIDGSTGQ
jgi:Protein of unknown function (DUF664)